MKRIVLLVGVAMAAVLGACNNVGNCPSAAIVPGGSCSGDNLECPYTIEQSLSPACDGTMAEGGIATSCVCTDGTWSCPAAVSCGSGASGDDGGSTGDDGGGTGEGAAD